MVTSSIDTPEYTYAPFILTTIDVAMSIDATVYFLIKGITIVKQRKAEKIKLGDFSSSREVMDQTIKSGVKMKVYEQSCSLLGLRREDFVESAKIVGAATLNDRLLDANSALSFRVKKGRFK